MDKNLFIKFAKVLGFNINESALSPVANEYDAEYPDNWDEMTDDEKASWKKEHMVKANVQAKPAEQPKPEPTPQPKAEIPAEIMQLNALVKDLGGVETVKTLLLSAATITANTLAQEETEREKLVTSIVANSAEKFAATDLADVELPVLRKMAEAFTPATRRIDYSAKSAVQNKGKASEKIAPRPQFFTAEKAN